MNIFTILVLLFACIPSGSALASQNTNTDFSSSLFSPTYNQARQIFRSFLPILKNSKILLDHQTYKVPSLEDQDLEIDSLFISGANPTGNLLIITSGVHGAEAYTGSALQSYFLKNIYNDDMLKGMSILIIHSLNPHGFRYRRRVTENNVDLNRNFISKTTNSVPKNTEYKNLSQFLNPEKIVTRGWTSDFTMLLKTIWNVILYGKQKLRQATVGGQYTLASGVFYGGQSLEPNSEIFRDILEKYALPFRRIMHIDLHTGYGEKGKLHLFSTNTIKNPDHISENNRIFENLQVDRGDDKDFYSVSGEMTQYTVEALAPRLVVPMTFEFGTQDSQTLSGSLFSLRTMILENQGFHFGYKSDSGEKQTLGDFKALFDPEDKAWREQVVSQFEETLANLISRFVE